jgi:hypothetical protein
MLSADFFVDEVVSGDDTDVQSFSGTRFDRESQFLNYQRLKLPSNIHKSVLKLL